MSSLLTTNTDARCSLCGADSRGELVVFGPSELRGGALAALHRQMQPPQALSEDLRWLTVLNDGLQQAPYCIAYLASGKLEGTLPLALVDSWTFGRFLVSLPYLNSGGVAARHPAVAQALIDHAVEVADRLNVRFLELRHEAAQEHVSLTHTMASKVHMRLSLPATSDELWTQLKSKVRNQIRKGEGQPFEVHWGGDDLLGEFYSVFSQNMRDLGTPVFGRRLFRSILASFPKEAEFCVLKLGRSPVAAALLLYGSEITEVPSASSLRSFNSTNANMIMYWHLLKRAIERGQVIFDFGRSTVDSNTFKFKKQWGAVAHPAIWQYYVRHGEISEMRPDNWKYKLAISAWRRLPVWFTRLIGPSIVRCIP